jgi:hypothetical protein
MAWNFTEEDLRGRIDDLEAVVNGLMIYIAAKELGGELDSESAKVKDFLKSNTARPMSSRLKQTGGVAGDGYWDGLPSGKIPSLREKLKSAGLP